MMRPFHLGCVGRLLSVAGVLSEKPWRVEAVLQMCLALFFFLFLGAVLVALLGKAGRMQAVESNQFLPMLVGTLTMDGSMLVLIGVFLRQHRVPWRDAFGLHQPNLWRSLGLAVMVACLVFPMANWLQWVSAQALSRLGYEPEAQHVVTFLISTPVWWQRAYMAVFTIALAPIVEEFVFRGVLFPLLKQSGYRRTAWVGVSMLFAAIHGNPPALLSFFVLALALTWLYEETDTLLAPITVHSLFNAANFVLLLMQDHVFQGKP